MAPSAAASGRSVWRSADYRCANRAASVLLALETLALDGGHLDLGKHEVVFAGLRMNRGQRPGRHRRGGARSTGRSWCARRTPNRRMAMAPAVAASPARRPRRHGAWRWTRSSFPKSRRLRRSGGWPAGRPRRARPEDVAERRVRAGWHAHRACGDQAVACRGPLQPWQGRAHASPKPWSPHRRCRSRSKEPASRSPWSSRRLTAARGFTARQAAASPGTERVEIGSGRIELSSAGAAMSGAADTQTGARRYRGDATPQAS